MKIPMLDLKAQYKCFEKEVLVEVKDIMERQDFVLGKEVQELEEKIARYCHTKYAIGVASGTDALILALRAMGIGPGTEVITTPFTFVATAEAIALTGAKPVFVDINPGTYNIEPSLIEERITSKTKAVIPVHLYGLCADMDPILKIAKKHDLKILEDCAQAIGSEYKGRRTGSMGDAGAISFFPSKNLGAFGEGGMVVTNNEAINGGVRLLRVHGSDKRYYHDIIGYNSRLDNLQAAILGIKLKLLDQWIEERISLASFFNEQFSSLPVDTPRTPEGYKHSYHLYVLRSKEKERIEAYLNDKGIESRTYYPIPLHLQKCFNYLGYKEGACPNAEAASKETFSIPVYPELNKDQREYIADTVRQFFKK